MAGECGCSWQVRRPADQDHKDLAGATGHPDHDMAQAALMASLVIGFNLVLLDICTDTGSHQIANWMAYFTGIAVDHGMTAAGKKTNLGGLSCPADRELDFAAVLVRMIHAERGCDLVFDVWDLSDPGQELHDVLPLVCELSVVAHRL